jgi:pimeloyl-ACP methyl ester carboxylesterase
MIRRETGRFISFDGTPIYYEVRGHGRPMVFCYGIGCLMNHWQHQVKYFSQSAQVITLDYRGHQLTPRPADMAYMSIDALAKDVVGLVDHLGFKRADFWGHSFGAQVLLRAYTQKPEIFNSMVMVNGFASDPISGMFGVNFLPKIFDLFRAGYEKFPDMVRSMWKLAITSPAFIPLSAITGGFNLHLSHIKDIEIYARGIGSMDLNVFITLFEDMLRYDGRPVLDTIHCPTLIVAGEKDGITPPSYQREMHQRIANSEFQMVPYGSHCTQLDFPDFVNLRAEKFFFSLKA